MNEHNIRGKEFNWTSDEFKNKKKTNKEICNIEEKWTVAKESNTNRVFVTNYHAHAIANHLYGVLALFSIFFLNMHNDWTHIPISKTKKYWIY